VVTSAQFLLDTDICIEILRKRGAAARPHLIQNEGLIAVSAITTYELEFGLLRSRQQDCGRLELADFLSRFDILPFDDRAAQHASRVRMELASLGKPIGPYDTLLAGHAKSLGLIMVTNNTKHFNQVPNLEIENWLA